jgi:peptidyl-prolyl cis-trans isomerase B (cyclophilin B)
MKKIAALLSVSFFLGSVNTKNMLNAQTILLETSKGNIKISLSDKTPLHRDNFIKLVNEGYYDGLLFHRIIAGFMIQTGDPDSKNSKPGQPLGMGGPSYTIPAEFSPELFHKKGAVAAARKGDAVNPEKRSSGSQFYIVQGNKLTSQQLSGMEDNSQHIPFSPVQREIYTTVGGTPHLDGAYTVFGEVIEGLDIVDSIANAPTSQGNRPVTDIKIIRASVIK